MGEGQKFYTVKEVADMLRVSQMTIVRELDRGNLKGVRVAKNWRISEENLKNYLERNDNK